MKSKTGKLLSFLLTLAMVVGLVPGMSVTAYAYTSINGHHIKVYDSAMGTVKNDMTCTMLLVYKNSTLTINQGVTLTLDNPDFSLMDHSKIILFGTLAGRADSGVEWKDSSYILVYLSDGAKYTVTGVSCGDGDNHLVYVGYDAATDGNGTVSVKNGSTNVTSASMGYRTTTYTFTATPSDGYKFKNWTKGAGGEVLGTDASINVTCEQNGHYQVYANFESDKTAQTISFRDGSAEAALTIKPAMKPAVTRLPKTGDGAKPVLWLGMIAGGLAVAFVAGFVKKRRER